MRETERGRERQREQTRETNEVETERAAFRPPSQSSRVSICFFCFRG